MKYPRKIKKTKTYKSKRFRYVGNKISTIQNIKKIKAIVKTEMKKDLEDKEAYSASNATFFNSGIDSSADMIRVFPNITKGTNENNRIGNEIMGKSLHIKGFLRFLPQPASGSVNVGKWSNVGIRLMILSLKPAPNYDSAVLNAGLLNNLLKKGGTTVAFTGAISDLFADVNSDVFTTHFNKVYFVSQSYLLQPTGAGNQSALAVDVSKLVKFFNIKLSVNKKLKYDDGTSSSQLPTNYGPFMVAGYTYMDGSSPDVLSTNLQISWDVIFKYEDA